MNDPFLSNMLSSPVALTIFIITLITSVRAFRDFDLKLKFILNPYKVFHYKEYYRIFTSGIIHGDQMHLAFNMLTFYFFAFTFEKYIGPWQFAVFYALSLVLSDLTTLFKHKDNHGYNALGASGAISAILFGMIFCDPGITILLFFAIPIPGPLFAVLYVAYSHYAAKKANDNIGHEAHLWGALAGLVLTPILAPQYIPTFLNFFGLG